MSDDRGFLKEMREAAARSWALRRENQLTPAEQEAKQRATIEAAEASRRRAHDARNHEVARRLRELGQ